MNANAKKIRSRVNVFFTVIVSHKITSHCLSSHQHANPPGNYFLNISIALSTSPVFKTHVSCRFLLQTCSSTSDPIKSYTLT